MISAKLLHSPSEKDGAEETFNAVLEQIGAARNKIAIHMYVWRSDAIGNQIGEALLKAARRGVEPEGPPGAALTDKYGNLI